MTSLTQITVPFHKAELCLVEYNGQPYTAMRPIVEGMGLAWQAQFEKLKQRFNSVIMEIMTTGKDGKQYQMLCLPLKKLFGWLMTISPNKVKPELRDMVIKYQEECDDVLWDYWTKGQAINQRASITPEQKDTLQKIVDHKASGNDGLRPQIWTRHNRHFRINSYHELLTIHFEDAIKYLLEMEVKQKPEKQEIKTLPYPQEVIQVAQQINNEYNGGRYHSWFVNVRDDGQLSAMPLLKGYYPINLAEFSKKFDGLLEFVYGNELLTTGRFLANK